MLLPSLMCALLTVTDANLRTSFASAATDQALRIAWGGWSWRPDKPYPDWQAVLAAKLYTDEEFLPLRKVLMAKRFRATQAPGSSMDVMTVKVEGGVDGGRSTTIRTYAPRTVRGVPDNVAGVIVRLAIHHARALAAAPEHVHAALSAGGLVAIWGVTADVRYVSAQVPDVGFPLTTVDILLFIKGRVSGVHSCQQLLVRLAGTTGHLTHQVCTDPLTPPPVGGVWLQ